MLEKAPRRRSIFELRSGGSIKSNVRAAARVSYGHSKIYTHRTRRSDTAAQWDAIKYHEIADSRTAAVKIMMMAKLVLVASPCC